ncbi:hypothetical protein, partial [Rahnella sp. CFA14(1/10)]|uniref:hypothetical protein n=1 Tax=Rahnella sp. CFA14(1/10) TaxID=2511203 RepID=UPI00198253C5
FSLAEDTDDLFVGKTLLHGDVLMWLMKTLLTSWCINQRGAGHMSSLSLVTKDASLWKRLKSSLTKLKNCFRQQSRNLDGPEHLLCARSGP